MTIEEYISTELDDRPNPENIIFLGFEASPSRVWSEWTSEDFSCRILFDRTNKPYKIYNRDRPWNIFLSEENVCDFLNTVFPAKG